LKKKEIIVISNSHDRLKIWLTHHSVLKKCDIHMKISKCCVNWVFLTTFLRFVFFVHNVKHDFFLSIIRINGSRDILS